jgi:hypothetical protein
MGSVLSPTSGDALSGVTADYPLRSSFLFRIVGLSKRGLTPMMQPWIYNAFEYRSHLSVAALTSMYDLFVMLPPNADSCDLHLLLPSQITSFGKSWFFDVLVYLWALHRELAPRELPVEKKPWRLKHFRRPPLRSQRYATNRTSSGNRLLPSPLSSLSILTQLRIRTATLLLAIRLPPAL